MCKKLANKRRAQISILKISSADRESLLLFPVFNHHYGMLYVLDLADCIWSELRLCFRIEKNIKKCWIFKPICIKTNRCGVLWFCGAVCRFGLCSESLADHQELCFLFSDQWEKWSDIADCGNVHSHTSIANTPMSVTSAWTLKQALFLIWQWTVQITVSSHP